MENRTPLVPQTHAQTARARFVPEGERKMEESCKVGGRNRAKMSVVAVTSYIVLKVTDEWNYLQHPEIRPHVHVNGG